MAFLAKENGGGSYEPIPEGVHHAVCVGMFDLGTQYNERFDTNKRMCLIMWELPDIRINFDSDEGPVNLPRIISKRYTLSLNEKANLRKDLESWRGKRFTKEELDGFDLIKLLGVNCSIQVLHKESNGKTYANIMNIIPMNKKLWKDAETEIRKFCFDDGDSIPDGTPEWITDTIKQAREWNASPPTGASSSNTHVDEDIPF